MTKPLIRIIDDEFDVLESVSFFLNNEGYQTQCYSSAYDFLTQDVPSCPGCAILDIQMPETNGLELQRMLLERKFPHPIIFFSAHGSIEIAVKVTKLGAFDFLQKPLDPTKLLEIIEKALKADLRKENIPDSEVQKILTTRELQVFRLSKVGLTATEIASELGCSVRTIESHRSSIKKKLKKKS